MRLIAPATILAGLLSCGCTQSKPVGQPPPDNSPSPVQTLTSVANPIVPEHKPAEPERFSDAQFQAHVERLHQDFDLDGFHIDVQPPFVVVGDEPAQVVRSRAQKTVKWTVDRLKQDYFKRDPNSILTIWLFKDGSSYRRHASSFFGDSPTTPYGYYSSAHRAVGDEHRHGGWDVGA